MDSLRSAHLFNHSALVQEYLPGFAELFETQKGYFIGYHCDTKFQKSRNLRSKGQMVQSITKTGCGVSKEGRDAYGWVTEPPRIDSGHR
jgi:hypothetical protein